MRCGDTRRAGKTWEVFRSTKSGCARSGDLCVDISGIYLSRVIRALSDCPGSARPIAIYELNAWPLAKSGKIDLVQVSDLVRSHYDCIEHTS